MREGPTGKAAGAGKDAANYERRTSFCEGCMNILVCGANGFIGRHLCAALEAAGHRVFRGVRAAHVPAEIAIDYTRDLDAAAWLPRLGGIDVVVNAVGILCEKKGQSFDAIHHDAPIALFCACAQAGVRRVIQISALGGRPEREPTPYMRSKREADAWLMASDLDWTILRPSLIVGMDGGSSRMFRALASLPVIGLPGRGEQMLQPVHIDDLCEAVIRLLASNSSIRHVLDIVGPRPMTYRDMLAAYRNAMRMPAPLWLPVPLSLMKPAAVLAAKLPQKVFSPDTLRMLEDGNVSDAGTLQTLLGRTQKGAEEWSAGLAPDILRWQAIAAWAVPLLRITLAMVWFVTALLSAGIFPQADSLALLQRVGLHGGAAQAALYGAALLDGALGVATLLSPGRLLWRLQFVLILFYTIVITIWLPEFWLHPFGPVLKNLPILALLAMLDASETS
jgi:uncharacterized protein YbjT (DUF2867 family)